MSNFEVVILDSYDGAGAFKEMYIYQDWISKIFSTISTNNKQTGYENMKKIINNSS